MSKNSGVSPTHDFPKSDSDHRRNRLDEGFIEPQQQWRMALASIGDAVIATDSAGIVTFLNPVAESLCGVQLSDSAGRPLGEIFRIVNEKTRGPVENPVDQVLATGSDGGPCEPHGAHRPGRERNPHRRHGCSHRRRERPGFRRGPRLPGRLGEEAGHGVERAAGGHRRVLGRHHRLEDLGRHPHELEPRGRANPRLYRRRGRREPRLDARASRAGGGHRGDPRPRSPRREGGPLPDQAKAEGRHHHRRLADGLADPQRGG